MDAQSAAHNSVFGYFTVEQDLYDDIETHAGGLEGFVQLDGLVLVSRKSIQQPSFLTVISLKAVENHGDGNVVRNQITFVDVGFGLGSELGTIGNVFTKNSTQIRCGGSGIYP